VAVVGQSISSLTISRQGNRLAYTQETSDANIWRMELLGSMVQSNSMTRLISSTRLDFMPQYSPEGKRIVFQSDRSGSSELWVCDSEGKNPVQLTTFGGPLTGTPRWSPDGQRIAFDSRLEGNADIYVISAEGGKPHRLTTETSEDIVPSWSRDGKWIYFCSNRSGNLQVWKMPVEGGEAVQMTKQDGFEGFESPDGKFFYYAKGRNIPGLWRIPVGGGEETPVISFYKAGWWRSWAVIDGGIYFLTAEPPPRPVINFFSFATNKVKQIAKVEKEAFVGLSVSPDGRWLIYTQIDDRGSDIMLMNNFH